MLYRSSACRPELRLLCWILGGWVVIAPLPAHATDSPVAPITDIFVDVSRLHHDAASNGDTWDYIWADDDQVYSFACDGRGYGRVSRNVNFNKLTGDRWTALTGACVNSLDDYGGGGQSSAQRFQLESHRRRLHRWRALWFHRQQLVWIPECLRRKLCRCKPPPDGQEHEPHQVNRQRTFLVARLSEQLRTADVDQQEVQHRLLLQVRPRRRQYDPGRPRQIRLCHLQRRLLELRLGLLPRTSPASEDRRPQPCRLAVLLQRQVVIQRRGCEPHSRPSQRPNEVRQRQPDLARRPEEIRHGHVVRPRHDHKVALSGERHLCLLPGRSSLGPVEPYWREFLLRFHRRSQIAHQPMVWPLAEPEVHHLPARWRCHGNPHVLRPALGR